jgi:hypothetical protein
MLNYRNNIQIIFYFLPLERPFHGQNHGSKDFRWPFSGKHRKTTLFPLQLITGAAAAAGMTKRGTENPASRAPLRSAVKDQVFHQVSAVNENA